MSRRDTLLLRITSVWTVLIWAVFVKNQLGNDETTAGFKAVHLTLAVVSVALAAVVWRVASRNAGSGRHEEERARTLS